MIGYINNLPGSFCIVPESEAPEVSDDENLPCGHCYQENKVNPNITAQALLLGSNQQADTIDVYLQEKFQRRVTVGENCSDADCMLPFRFSIGAFWKALNYGEMKFKGEKSLKWANRLLQITSTTD